jgi:hypothetical protein
VNPAPQPPQSDQTSREAGVTLPDFLAHNDAACPHCDYQLRGVAEPRCPECGTELRLGVITPPRPLLYWSLAVTAIAMGLGFDAVTVVLMFIPIIFSGGQAAPFIAAPMIVMAFGALSCTLALRLLLRRQARWFDATPKKQRERVYGVFATVFFFHLFLGFAAFATSWLFP